MALQFESFPDKSFKCKWSRQYGTTTYAMDIHVQYLGHALSAPEFYYSLLLNVCDVNANEIFHLELKGRGGGEAVWASFTLNTLNK